MGKRNDFGFSGIPYWVFMQMVEKRGSEMAKNSIRKSVKSEDKGCVVRKHLEYSKVRHMLAFSCVSVIKQ